MSAEIGFGSLRTIHMLRSKKLQHILKCLTMSLNICDCLEIFTASKNLFFSWQQGTFPPSNRNHVRPLRWNQWVSFAFLLSFHKNIQCWIVLPNVGGDDDDGAAGGLDCCKFSIKFCTPLSFPPTALAVLAVWFWGLAFRKASRWSPSMTPSLTLSTWWENWLKSSPTFYLRFVC